MLIKKYVICLSMLASTGYSVAADHAHNNPLLRAIQEVIHEREQEERAQNERETTFLEDFQEGFNIAQERFVNEAQIASDMLSTYQGLEKYILKPTLLGFTQSTLFNLTLSLDKKCLNLDSKKKQIIATGCGAALLAAPNMFAANECKAIAYFVLPSIALRHRHQFQNPSILMNNLFIGAACYYPNLAFFNRTVLKYIQTVVEDGNNQDSLVEIILPAAVYTGSLWLSDFAIKAALEYIKPEELAHAAFEKTIEGTILVAGHAKPAIESCCSIQ